jgi:uncharacterized protein (DUF1501 family)
MASQLSRRRFLTEVLSVGAVSALARFPDLRGDLARLAASVANERSSSSSRKALVLCTLYGGCDGLNVVVPYAESAYQALRGQVALPGAEVLQIGSAAGIEMGLHPALTGLQQLFKAGHVAVVMGVGYPNPSFSHFQSMDIWQTGDPSGNLDSGWLGRWLDRGDGIMRALSVGTSCPIAFSGQLQRAGTLVDSLAPEDQMLSGDPGFKAGYTAMQRPFRGESLLEALLAGTGKDFLTVGHNVAKVMEAAHLPAPATKLASGDLGNQLDIVAELLRGDLPTLAYGVSQYGYDTHTNELLTQAGLLSQLDAAVTNFFAATATGTGPSPVMVIHTEFGRRVQPNASQGTDHGSANNVLVIGPRVKGGFYGEFPNLRNLDDGNLRYTTDFRRVYATALESILEINAKEVLGRGFAPLGFLS